MNRNLMPVGRVCGWDRQAFQRKIQGNCAGEHQRGAGTGKSYKKELFCRTVSYHSSGGVIYWAFGQQGELASRTQTFAKRIAAVTGYEPDGNYEELDRRDTRTGRCLRWGFPV